MPGLEAPSHWVILALVVLVLFGYKKLPEMSRSVGRSLRIFKTEMKGMGEDDSSRDAAVPQAGPPVAAGTPVVPSAPVSPAAPVVPVVPPVTTVVSPVPGSTQTGPAAEAPQQQAQAQ